MLKNLINSIIGNGRLVATIYSEERVFEKVAYMLYQTRKGRRYYKAKSSNWFWLGETKTKVYATVVWPWLNGNDKPLKRLGGGREKP